MEILIFQIKTSFNLWRDNMRSGSYINYQVYTLHQIYYPLRNAITLSSHNNFIK